MNSSLLRHGCDMPSQIEKSQPISILGSLSECTKSDQKAGKGFNAPILTARQLPWYRRYCHKVVLVFFRTNYVCRITQDAAELNS
jgi:hypothetical protein